MASSLASVPALRALVFAVGVALAAVSSSAEAGWEYVAASGTSAARKGQLSTINRGKETFVSAKQFCFALGCRVFYQWSSHRAIIQNSSARVGAVVSSITRVALADGKVLDFKGPIVTDLKEGYLLPIDLSLKLATALRLGRIYEIKDTKSEPAASQGQAVALKKIMIDPGHGGNDWGTGLGSVYEKDLAYFYAEMISARLKEAAPELEIRLTRDGDRYVSLPDRAKVANTWGADLFISIHVNHAPDPSIEGGETYILSPDATDDEAKKLALLENNTWMKTANIQATEGDTVKRILVDMEQTKYIQNSALAASLIQQELAQLEKSHGLKNRGVKQAMFYVLSQVAMPSVLMEIGFLSSTGDRSRLLDLAFRDEFVRAVVTALKRYREKIGN